MVMAVPIFYEETEFHFIQTLSPKISYHNCYWHTLVTVWIQHKNIYVEIPKINNWVCSEPLAQYRGFECGYGLELRLDSTVPNIETPTTHFNNSSLLKDAKTNPS